METNSLSLQFTEEDCLSHGVTEIIGGENLREALRTRALKVKLGIDPTSPLIHLGRSITLWRLRAFQELGHEIHFIIGDFTGQIGDTSDKDVERPMLSRETIEENLRRYEEQVWLILNPDKREKVFFHRNSEWLAALSLAEVGALADAFSVNSFIKRELVAKRLESGSRVSLREMLYPLMQGYDSVQLGADVEIGGTDQRFNLLAGRTLQERYGQAPQAVIMNHLIAGTDGRKMSSSWGNVITLLDSPEDKFGKLMRIPDEILEEYLLIFPLSAQPFSQEELRDRLKRGENPRDLKLAMAEALVALYHGQEIARQTREQFIAQFQLQQLPEGEAMVQVAWREGLTVLDALVADPAIAGSRSEARRLIQPNGVKIGPYASGRPFTGEKCTDPFRQVQSGEVIVVGRKAVRIS
jgi:tyrosyl-tRNA synthetase